MRRVVADHLEPRLCRDAVSVVTTVVPVDDAIALLRAGFAWSVRYDRGRLLAEVSSWDLLAAGHVEILRRWAGVHERPGAVHRALRGEPLDDAELDALACRDLIDVRLAQRCLGRAVTAADVAAIEARASADDQARLRELRVILASPVGAHQPALTDEPIALLDDDPTDAHVLDLCDYAWTGDHAGCLRRLRAAVAHAAEVQGSTPTRTPWPRLARVCRFLTEDDAAAMALLDRAPLVDTHDDWIEIFGELGVARLQRAKDVVLDALERAFDGVPFPGPRHRSLFQAEAADSYAGCDQSRDHTGRWQDLPREHILACQFALPHLEGESLQYCLPALVSFVVREHDRPSADHGTRWIFETVEYHLRFSLADRRRRDDQAARHERFTPAQFAAIAAFADYYRCSPADRARWHALGRGEPWPPAEPS
ncbi:MAG: hypothetical protein K8M05_12755 [Deltaproteobacteria bacterium]|nr:hypothetical protein [Kofleriaceae bacterium]